MGYHVVFEFTKHDNMSRAGVRTRTMFKNKQDFDDKFRKKLGDDKVKKVFAEGITEEEATLLISFTPFKHTIKAYQYEIDNAPMEMIKELKRNELKMLATFHVKNQKKVIGKILTGEISIEIFQKIYKQTPILVINNIIENDIAIMREHNLI